MANIENITLGARRSRTLARRAAGARETAPTTRPDPLGYQDPARFPDLYVVNVRGDCLAPKIPDGSKLLCNKTMPCRPGDLVLIYFTPDAIRQGRPTSMVKRLVLPLPPVFSKDPLVVSFDNPPRTLSIRFDAVQAVHRGFGPLDLSVVESGQSDGRKVLRFRRGYLEKIMADKPRRTRPPRTA